MENGHPPDNPLSRDEAPRSSGEIGVETIRPPPPPPDNTDIHSLCQRGDYHALLELYKSDPSIDLSSRDAQDVTPLHWACINAHIGICRWLLDNGADVDAKGGELKATPLQWAARNGHLYVVHLLMSRGADPNILDAQGFNTLQLITHSSAVMPLLYMLHQPVAIDEKDTDGHTPLMWAAYQGDAISVDLLLRHGASVSTVDNAGMTPLHWAAVKGSKACIKYLLEKGADMNARESQGKTPKDMAEELKGLIPFEKGLDEAGFKSNGMPKIPYLTERNTIRAVFVIPTIVMGSVFKTFATFPAYLSFPLAILQVVAMQYVIARRLLAYYPEEYRIANSPYFAAIILASLFWVCWGWATKLLFGAIGHAFAHLWFFVSASLCAWALINAIRRDPGFAPKAANDSDIKMALEDLVDAGRLNGTNFCIECMQKRPLRSKHCRQCHRCVARFDHHCPWIWNCVGAGNHRLFLTFVLSLISGIVLFDHLSVAYILEKAPEFDWNSVEGPSLCAISETICRASSYDPFILATAIWSTLQLTWTSILSISQLWQVSRQMTTLEVSNLGRYGFMGGRGGASLREQSGAIKQAAAVGAGIGPSGAEEEAAGGEAGAMGMNMTPEGVGLENGHTGHVGHHGGGGEHQHSHGVGALCKGLKNCLSGPMMKVLGLDRFTKGRAVSGMRRAGRDQNPFDMGFFKNCQDFWIGHNDVDWTTLYDMPVEGWPAYRRKLAMRGPDSKGYRQVHSEVV